MEYRVERGKGGGGSTIVLTRCFVTLGGEFRVKPVSKFCSMRGVHAGLICSTVRRVGGLLVKFIETRVVPSLPPGDPNSGVARFALDRVESARAKERGFVKEYSVAAGIHLRSPSAPFSVYFVI